MRVLILSSLLVGAAATAATAQTRAALPPGSPFLGGVPTGVASANAVPLTIGEVIGRALDYNLGVMTAEQALGRARGTRSTFMASLLPNIDATLSEARQTLNLAAFGFPLPAGVPSVVGPFNLFDARVSVSQSVFDVKAMNDVKAEQHRVSAAAYSVKSARDIVVLVSGNLYLQVLAAGARVAAVEAQAQTAESLLAQTQALKEAGLVPAIDVVRAGVQSATQKQRLTATRNELERTRLLMARVIGLPLGQDFTVSDTLPELPADTLTLDQALARAYAQRPDYLAALERVRAAEATRAGIVGEYLPSVKVNAAYGVIGHTPSEARGTYSVAGAVRVPLFNGGRTRGRVAEADADVAQRRAEADDLKASIYYDIRAAMLDVEAAAQQLDVATRTRALADEQLALARDRFAAGVTTHIEVVQAQDAVASATEQLITARFAHLSARSSLVRDLGIAEATARQTFSLGGAR